jgi:hypothetical protein
VWFGLLTGDWIGLAGLVVSIAGFGFALDQLRRVKAAAVAAKDAAERQQQKTAGAMLLQNVEKLERTELDIREAAGGGYRAQAARAIAEWRRTAAEVQGLIPVLDAHADQYQELRSALELSIALVDVALDDVNDEALLVQDVCRPLLGQASRACATSRELATALIVSTNRD